MATMLQILGRRLAIVSAVFAIGFGLAGSAHAQLFNQPYTRTQQNRASIASLIYQVEQAKSSSSSSSSSGSVVNLVCGGAGDSVATANSSCIILNNSVADLGLDQNSKGNQTATNNQQTTTTSGADDVLATLNSDN